MGSIDDSPRKLRILERRKEKSIERFNNNTKTINQSFLIICEGENTEPDYFNEFKVSSARIEAIGEGKNTISLVNRAFELKKEYLVKGRKFDQYWVVFDKDSFPDNDYNNAVFMAEKAGFNVAYSNQSFEYWFLLHFNLHQGAINRDSYSDTLSKYLGFKYGKESEVSSSMFNSLLRYQTDAIRNAKLVYESFDAQHLNPAKEESSTTVFKLVEELNKYL
jgi:hypothetical protein